MTSPTTPNTGAGTLRAKAAALHAKWAADKAAKGKLAASKPTTATTAPQARSVAQSVPLVSVLLRYPPGTAIQPPPPPAALPPVATADPTGILATYRNLTGAEGIKFFLAHEKEIRAARAGVALDAGKFAHLSGLDRVRAAVRIATP
jgi:hypothetical protein